MASIFTTGTINQPDAGSVGLAMVEKLRDDIVAHAAWDLVEEFTAAAGTCRWYVFKCLAAESGLPSDFFVIISRTLGNGELRFTICETYTPGSHIAQHFPGASYTQGGITFDSSGRFATTYTLSTVPLPASSNTPRYAYWIPSGTSTKWWLIVSEDTITVAFNGASNGFVHIGAYTPLCAMPITLPLQFIGRDTNDAMGGITRNPAAADITSTLSALAINGGSGSSAGSYGPILGFSSDLRYNDKLNAMERAVAEQGMTINPYNVGDQAAYGWALGKQKRMRVTNQSVPVGFAFGDAYVLSGKLWVPFKPDDGRMWDTGVASS